MFVCVYLCLLLSVIIVFFCFKQKTAYEMRISDWSSDVCSSDLVVNEQQTWRIVYNALTRQWRVGTGELSLPESSLDDALSLVRNIRGWAVADAKDLEHNELYQGRIRVRLDTSLLARPFQVDAINKIGRAACRERVGQEV